MTAKVTFNFFEWRENLADSLFEIPPRYHEDPSRFPDLWLLQDISIVEIICSLRKQVVFEELDNTEDREMDGSKGLGKMDMVLAVDIPLTNLGSASTEMVLMFP